MNAPKQFRTFCFDRSDIAPQPKSRFLGVILICSGFANAMCTLGGKGTASTPYLVGTYAELKQVGTSCSLDSTYRMTADIDASPSKAENNGAGFVPIGNVTPFGGIFHGAGHVIRGLFINDAADAHVGLFGAFQDASNKTLVDSLGLVDAQIVGGSSSTGGIAGESNIVNDCFVTGKVSGSGTVGGVVGEGFRMDHCYMIGTVSGGQIIGGVTGWNDWGSVDDCFMIGDVLGGPQSTAGGVLGQAGIENSFAPIAASITNSYAIGKVTGRIVGGIVGLGVGAVANTYFVGVVLGVEQSDFGGISGIACGSVMQMRMGSKPVASDIENSYWSIDVAGAITGVGKTLCIDSANYGGTPWYDTAKVKEPTSLMTVQMRDSGNFTGFGFDLDSSAWTIVQGVTYPLLRGMPNGIQAQVAAQAKAAAGVLARAAPRGGVKLGRDGGAILLSLPASARVSVLDVSGRQLVPEVEVSAGTHALALPRRHSMVFVRVQIGSATTALPLELLQ